MHTHTSWAWTAFITAFGLLLLWKPKFLAFDAGAKLLRFTGNDEQQRVAQALERRTHAEHVSAIPGYIGGVGSLVLAAISAFTPVPPVLMYAVFCLWISAIIALTFIQLRNAQPKRVAVLSPRTPSAVIPWWIVAGVVLSALAPLVYVTQPAYAVGAIIICCSTLATLAVAWRLTQLPALLQGQDLPAEVFIDNRLRAHRSGGPLILAVVQPFALMSQIPQSNGIESAASILTLILFIFVMFWRLRGFYKPATLSAA